MMPVTNRTNEVLLANSGSPEHASTEPQSDNKGMLKRTVTFLLAILSSHGYYRIHHVTMNPSQDAATVLKAMRALFNSQTAIWTRLVSAMFTDIALADGVIAEV